MKKSTMKALAELITDAKTEVGDRPADTIGRDAAEAFMKANYDAFAKFSRAVTYGR